MQTRIFFPGSRKVVDQKKKIRVCRTTFVEPLFYTFLEKWLQIKWSNGLKSFFNLIFHKTIIYLHIVINIEKIKLKMQVD